MNYIPRQFNTKKINQTSLSIFSIEECNLGFKCKVNGVYQCIRPHFKCDGKIDCDNAADEDAKACPRKT